MEQQPFDPAEARITDRERRRRRRKEWWQRFIERRNRPQVMTRAEQAPEPVIERPRQKMGRRVLRLLGLGPKPRDPEQQPFLERGIVGHVRRATKAVLRLVIATEGRVQQEMANQPQTADAKLQPRLKTVEQQLRVQNDRLDTELRVSPATAPRPQLPQAEEAPAAAAVVTAEPRRSEASPPTLAPSPSLAEVVGAASIVAGASFATHVARQHGGNNNNPAREAVPNWASPMEIKTQQAVLDQQRHSLEQAPVQQAAAVIELASAQAILTERTADILQHQRQQREVNIPPSAETLAVPMAPQLAPEQIRKAVHHEMQAIIDTAKEIPPAPTEQELADRVERDPGRNWEALPENNNGAQTPPLIPHQDKWPATNQVARSPWQPKPSPSEPQPPVGNGSFQHAVWWTIAGAVMVALGGFLLSMVR